MIAHKVMTLCISFNGMQFNSSSHSTIRCVHNWNISTLHLGINSRMEKFLSSRGRCENENCLHKYLYLFAHLQSAWVRVIMNQRMNENARAEMFDVDSTTGRTTSKVHAGACKG